MTLIWDEVPTLSDIEQFDESRHGENLEDLSINVGQNQTSALGSTLFIQLEQTAKPKATDIFQLFTIEHNGLAGMIHQSLEPISINTRREFYEQQSHFDLDFSDVRGQESVKRALEVAAAGGLNLIMIGPPGLGKSMLAKRLPGILMPLSLSESLEATQTHSVAGKLGRNMSLISQRPFRALHHTISQVAGTIADLEASDRIQSHHIAEAIGYRNLDRSDWAERGI